MAKKKDENPFIPDPATVVKPADLVAETIPPAKTEIPPAETGGNSNGSAMADESGKAAENAEPINPPEKPQPVATPESASQIPAVTVTPEQLVSDQIPQNVLPPVPGQPKEKGKRGRPSIPHPECKKCGRKHKPGLCLTENGASQINIASAPLPTDGEAPDLSEAIEEKPAVNYRQLAEVCFDLSTSTAGAIIGPEWRAQDEKEREGMLIPLEMYLRAQEVKDIPPGAVLCFAIAGYAVARFRVPNTRTKFSLAWAWLKSKMPGKRKSFVPKVVKDGNPFSEQSGPA
jgi:hypothetical protein